MIMPRGDENIRGYEHIETLAITLIAAVLAILAMVWWLASAAGAEEIKIDMHKIMMIESSGNPLAHNKRDDSRGLYQITPACLADFNAWHKKKYSMDDMWDPVINREVAEWYLTQRIPAMLEHYEKPVTVESVIFAYNAGISYPAQGKKMPVITQKYLTKYHKK